MMPDLKTLIEISYMCTKSFELSFHRKRSQFQSPMNFTQDEYTEIRIKQFSSRTFGVFQRTNTTPRVDNYDIDYPCSTLFNIIYPCFDAVDIIYPCFNILFQGSNNKHGSKFGRNMVKKIRQWRIFGLTSKFLNTYVEITSNMDN